MYNAQLVNNYLLLLNRSLCLMSRLVSVSDCNHEAVGSISLYFHSFKSGLGVERDLPNLVRTIEKYRM
jgi:hypothetical protein